MALLPPHNPNVYYNRDNTWWYTADEIAYLNLAIFLRKLGLKFPSFQSSPRPRLKKLQL